MARGKHNGNGHKRHDLHVTETPDVSHIKNLDVTHEASDISVSGVLKFVLGLSIMTVAVFVLMWAMFRLMYAQEAEKEPDPGPMAMSPQERLPPDPKLQAAPGFGLKLENGEWVPLDKREPEAEYRVLREQWERQLNCKHDEHEGSSPGAPCLPIDAAIEKLFEGKGPSSRGAAPGQETSLSLPTTASSGRVTGK